MCQGLSHFSAFLHHLLLAKFAISSIRVIGLKVPVMFSSFPIAVSNYKGQCSSSCVEIILGWPNGQCPSYT